MRIAVDFDGTIVENQYPGIGPEKIFAIATLIEIQKQGHQLILWTCRSGKELNDAVEFCRNRGLIFYAVNQDYPEEVFDNSGSRKVDADIYIDDKNLGGFAGWDRVWDFFRPDKHLDDVTQQLKLLRINRPSFWNRLIGIFRHKTNSGQ